MSDFRTLVSEQAGSAMKFEVFELTRKTHTLVGMNLPPLPMAANTQVVTHASAVRVGSRQVRVTLEGGSAMIEPGALQYAHGKLAIEVQKHDKNSNIFTRAMASAGSGEAGFATKYTGHGVVWTEPTHKHFICAAMDGPEDALLLDDQAFYACESSITLSTHIHRSVQGLLAGNGLMQPKISGRGAFVVECPVPIEEIEVIEVTPGNDLVVDGDLMLMYSATLKVELKPLTKGLRNLYRSGEGLVYVLSGTGTVWLTPTARMGH